MSWSLLRTIVVLPGTALVFVPALVLWAAAGTRWAHAVAGAGDARLWAGLALAAAGLALAIATVRLFTTLGRGTPAPWDPPARLVVAGPYRYVRNPMITAVVVVLAGEALLLASWPIAAWGAAFLAINMVYFPLAEEPGLERRFGEAYRAYKANVPRWLPRPTPWTPPDN